MTVVHACHSPCRLADPSDCGECGVLTTSNIGQYVSCRLECVHFDFTGTRVTPTCGAGASYFSAIDECVPLSIASSPVFLASFEVAKHCTGGVISTVAQLEGLRFCDTVTTELIISVNDAGADFSALRDMEIIMGLVIDGRCMCLR